jgi:hypothetical protein
MNPDNRSPKEHSTEFECNLNLGGSMADQSLSASCPEASIESSNCARLILPLIW